MKSYIFLSLIAVYSLMRHCNAGQCKSKTGLHNSCSTDAQCQSGFCRTNQCKQPQNDYNSCKKDAGCKSGFCRTNQCKNPNSNWNSCSRNAECQSGYCATNKCKASGQSKNYSSCNNHAQCQSGFCRTNQCKPQQNDYTSCQYNEECKSGYCRGATKSLDEFTDLDELNYDGEDNYNYNTEVMILALVFGLAFGAVFMNFLGKSDSHAKLGEARFELGTQHFVRTN